MEWGTACGIQRWLPLTPGATVTNPLCFGTEPGHSAGSALGSGLCHTRNPLSNPTPQGLSWQLRSSLPCSRTMHRSRTKVSPLSFTKHYCVLYLGEDVTTLQCKDYHPYLQIKKWSSYVLSYECWAEHSEHYKLENLRAKFQSRALVFKYLYISTCVTFI